MNLKDAYTVLEVNPEFEIEKVKEVYHKLLLKHHPDKGGDADVFCKIIEAYKTIETFSNKQSDSEQPSSIDVFKSFLKTHLQKKLFKDYKTLYLTLEEMYTGKTIKINMTKLVDCDHCSKTYCGSCSGSGKVKHEILLFGIKQTMHRECGICEGLGYRRECVVCKDGYVENHHLYTLKIKRGCQIDDKYGIDDNATIFVIKQYNHPRFKRCNNDLILYKNISLYDAIACKKIKCRHLNGRIYSFTNTDTIQSDVIYHLESLGMPLKGLKTYGNLYIKFDIILPSKCNITVDESAILKKLFDITNGRDDDYTDCTNINLKQSTEHLMDKNLLRFIRVSG